MVPLSAARVTGSGTVQIGPPQCDGADALGGSTVAAAHPGRVYPPFPLTEADVPPPGGPQGYFYVPNPSGPPTVVQDFEALALPSGFHPTSFHGTPNDGGIWGLDPTVNRDFDYTRARWTFTVHPDNPICAAVISTDAPPPLGDGYDGHPFNTPPPGDHSLDSHYKFDIEADGVVVGSTRDLLTHILPEAFASYFWLPVIPTEATGWSLVFDAKLGGGGFDGFHGFPQLSIVSFLLYTLGSHGAKAVPGSGANRNYP